MEASMTDVGRYIPETIGLVVRPCTTSGAPITDRILSRQFHGAEGAEAWRVLPDGAYAFYRTNSLIASARFIDAISGLVPEGDEPYIDPRRRRDRSDPGVQG
jgi:hypothetical protein